MRHYSLSNQHDPAGFAEGELRLHLDPWQKRALHPQHKKGLINAGRQTGKTTITAIRVVHHLLFAPEARALVVSATEAQAALTIAKILGFLETLGEPVKKLPGRRYDWTLPSTGAQLRALPCREAAARGYTATFLVFDEAALIPDSVFHALTGTLATTWNHAEVWLLSTPRARRGFFYQIATSADPLWFRENVPATACPRITPEFLALQQAALPEHVFRQEYCCEFGDTALAVFKQEDLAAMLGEKTLAALSPTSTHLLGGVRHRLIAGLDLAQTHDHPALTILQYSPLWKGHDPYQHGHHYEGRLAVRWLQQLPLGIPYPDLTAYLRQIANYAEIQQLGLDLCVDSTGNHVFIDYLRKAHLPNVALYPIVITAGAESHAAHGRYYVPKQELLTHFQFLLRQRKLKIAPAAGHIDQLIREAAAIQRVTGPDARDFFIGSPGVHDDLLCSTALAAWWALRRHRHSLLQEAA